MRPYSGAKLLLIMWTTYLLTSSLFELYHDYSYSPASGTVLQQTDSGPFLVDPKLKAEVVAGGLNFPSSMAFLGENDILVLEKNEGTVRRIVNGVMQENPLLKVNVSSAGERGMLGIAVLKDNSTLDKPTYVFLYYTEVSPKEDPDNPNSHIRNRLYRYELLDGKLINPKLMLELPSGHGVLHNGGAISIGKDKNVYLLVGDMLGKNQQDSDLLTGTGGIFRMDQEGNPIKDEEGQYVLGNTHPANKYYAYGLRNGFGMDLDPITGKLWDTENGPVYGDEINLVEQGFNSGWSNIQGFWTEKAHDPGDLVLSPDPEDLANFGGKSEYSPPEFAAYPPVGFTALAFLNTDNYGKEYENDMLVGDFHNGNLYRLKLNENRTGLQLNGHLSDKIATNLNDLQEILLGSEFGGITDIEIGPDGYIYVLSLFQGGYACDQDKPGRAECIRYNLNATEPGTVFRIVS